MAALSERLTQLLEPVVNALGYELVLLEFSPHRGHANLRLYIDRLSGGDGIGLDDCEKVSREVAAALDVADPIPHSYRLEVSSPGLDRPLVKPVHFRRFRGAQVRVQTLAPLAGRRRFLGELVDADDTTVTLRTAEGSLRLPFADIERARLVPDYAAAGAPRWEPSMNSDGASDR
ncbi:MAG: ribosome maturation factor RimP [Sinobacteraceae bacterium]|nr:ribosome maturation factor RimP [Nevskia sp.]MDI3258213.1 ribosome maturation factor RimP [Nevskiaceae bacterium]